MAENKTNKPAKAAGQGKISKFFREYKSEIKKISWSKPSQTLNNTWAVIVSSVVLAVVIGLIDFLSKTGITTLGKLI